MNSVFKIKGFDKIVWALVGLLSFGGVYLFAIFPDKLWIGAACLTLSVGLLVVLFKFYKVAIQKRTLNYGASSAASILVVLFLLTVLNIISYRHQKNFDITKGKTNTLSDQSQKVVKNLTDPAKVIFFGNAQEKDKVKPLLENYKTAQSSKFEIDYVDPLKERSRAIAAGIQKSNTLQILVGARDSKVEEPTEEKITNALIKLTRTQASELCYLTGHGEKDFETQTEVGLSILKKSLQDQSYSFRNLNLMVDGKIPATCAAISVVGPNHGFVDAEMKTLSNYLAEGGRMIVALDLDVRRGADPSPEFTKLIGEWNLDAKVALILDPVSRVLQLEPTYPIMAGYSKTSKITQDMQGNAVFPFTRPIVVSATPTEGLKFDGLVQTTPSAWGEAQLTSIGKGAVQFNAGSDFKGPLYGAYSVEGKLKNSKAAKDTRLVVFGSTWLFTNQFIRLGNNLDLVANAYSWTLQDESMISIRSREEDSGKVELSNQSGQIIFLTVVLALPLLLVIAGVAVWFYRRRL